MILAAGLGTRLFPFTSTHPKALFKVGDITLLENAIRYLKAYGYDDIIINVHHFAEQIITFLRENDNFNVKITISDERSRLLDTGGALKKAAWFFDDNSPFIVYNVDIVTNLDLERMRRHHLDTDSMVTLAVRERRTSRYLLFDNNKLLCGWKNTQTGAHKLVTGRRFQYQFGFSGIQIVSPAVFKYFPDKDVFTLTDFYLDLARMGLKVTFFEHTADHWQDVGKAPCVKVE